MKFKTAPASGDIISRTSHEVRGLKYVIIYNLAMGFRSHLTRGAWIEIQLPGRLLRLRRGRTSHEVRGLK